MADASLLQQSFVYLGAGVASVPLARKLGLGSVLGYLLAGLLIGPYALGLVGGGQMDVMHFAEFGVVMMLFLIGLELKPSLLWSMRGAILGLGGLQVLITGVLLALLTLALGQDWRVATAIGMTLALSSTAIVLQSLEERGWNQHIGGKSSFSVLLFQDIAVIPMLAMLPLLAVDGGSAANLGGQGEGNFAPWQQAGLLILIVAALVLGGRFLARPVFRYIAHARLREIFTAAALLIVVALAYLMEKVGVSPALGAFLGGVVLAESEFRHELESDIEPFKGLLLGLFFISVGVNMDLSLLAENALLILGLVAGLMLLKLGVLLALGRLFGLGPMQNLLFAVSLAQGGEFGFVLFGAAVGYGVLPTELAALLTLVVALSMALTPIALIAYGVYRRRRAGPLQAETAAGPEAMEERDNEAIIIGFGRFGQVVGRLLHAHGFGVTLLDHDAGAIRRSQRFGYKVYYGDGLRLDLLESAGAGSARILVIAIDDPEETLQIVDRVRVAFPNLTLLVRAFDRTHAYELMQRNVKVIKRETFAAALELGKCALTELGIPQEEAEKLANAFRANDEQGMRELYTTWADDQDSYVLKSRERRAAFNEVMRNDRDHQEQDAA